MPRRPYKFLDAFEKEDHEIFFGRQREIEEIHSRLFYSNLLVLYGPSGTGKTSILKCGLTNRIPDSDWKPVLIRRNLNIIQSIEQELHKLAQTPLKSDFNIQQKLRSVYLDHLTPVFLIFDQLEELFVFGDQNEQQEFIRLITDITNDPEKNVKVIFIIREEYLADLSGFEEKLPHIFDNRFRIERMGRSHLLEAIKSPAEVCGVKIDEGLAEEAIEKITDEKGNTELTYVQVLMDHLYKVAEARDAENIYLQLDDLRKLGQLSNLMSKFLDDQLLQMDNAKAGEDVLKTMISLDGTKKPMRISDIQKSLQQLNKKVDNDQVLNIVQYFVNVRILREKDENGFYELRHDSLAYRIYERMTLVEKELIEVQQFLRQAFERCQRHRMLLRKEDLEYIFPYEGRLHLEKPVNEFIDLSRKSFERLKKRKRQIAISVVIALLFFFSSLTIWALLERRQAENQKKIALHSLQRSEEAEIVALEQQQLAEIQREKAENAYQMAISQVYDNITASLAISANNMNVLYRGIWNPVSISVSGLPPENLDPFIVSGEADIKGDGGNYEIFPRWSTNIKIGVKGYLSDTSSLDFGYKIFRVYDLPVPVASVAGVTGGRITLDQLRLDPRVRATSSAEEHFSGLAYNVKSFAVIIAAGTTINYQQYSKDLIGDEVFRNIEEVILKGKSRSARVWIESIIAERSYDGTQHMLPAISIEVTSSDFDPEKEKNKERINKLLFAAQEEVKIDPYKSYRFAEAAYLLDTTRDELKYRLISSYNSAFSDIKKRFGFDESSHIYFNQDLSRILEILPEQDKNQFTANLYEAFLDSIDLIRSIEFFDSFLGYGDNNALFVGEFLVIVHKKKVAFKQNRSEERTFLSIIDSEGEIMLERRIIQESYELVSGNVKQIFISLPEHQRLFNIQQYDGRASLWNVKGELETYLWGEEEFPQLHLGLEFASFSHNDSLILGCDRHDSQIIIYDNYGNELFTKKLAINPFRGIITPSMQIIYYGHDYNDNEKYGSQVYCLTVSDEANSVLIFDSIRSFANSTTGEYFLIVREDNNSEYRSYLYDHNIRLLATYSGIFYNTFRVDIEKNKMYLWNDDQVDQPRYIIMPVIDISNSIIRIINQEKLYGYFPYLSLDDLNKYQIETNVLEIIHEGIESIINRE
jgi:WD40 repeat protein